jgi:pyruvate kinase
MTFSGYTAYKVSSQRPKSDILVFTSNKRIMAQLSLVWGVRCYYYDRMVSTDHTIADILYLLKKDGAVTNGDYVINIASIPIEEQGKTNMIKLSQVE